MDVTKGPLRQPDPCGTVNFIDSGAFREYISVNVEDNERWDRAMRKFGICHDLMHELMSELAWHHVYELWRNKVKVVDLMHQRIDQLICKMLRHDDEHPL